LRTYSHAIDVLLNDTTLVRLYPEFKDRSTLSIIWEAQKREKSKRDLSEYFMLFQDLETLRGRLSAPATPEQQAALFSQIKKAAKKIDDM
jgi:hypothetical protein